MGTFIVIIVFAIVLFVAIALKRQVDEFERMYLDNPDNVEEEKEDYEEDWF